MSWRPGPGTTSGAQRVDLSEGADALVGDAPKEGMSVCGFGMTTEEFPADDIAHGDLFEGLGLDPLKEASGGLIDFSLAIGIGGSDLRLELIELSEEELAEQDGAEGDVVFDQEVRGVLKELEEASDADGIATEFGEEGSTSD